MSIMPSTLLIFFKASVIYLAILILSITRTSAEIHKCHEIYTNLPCDNLEHENTSEISPSTQKDTKHINQNTRAALKTNLTTMDESENDCTPVNNGIDLRIVDTSITQNKTLGNSKSTLKGIVRNMSNKYFGGPLLLIIKDLNGNVVERVKISTQLAESSSINFTSDLLFSNSIGHHGEFELSLSYAPALSCNVTKINLNSASLTQDAISHAYPVALDSTKMAKDIENALDILEQSLEKICSRINELKSFQSRPKNRCLRARKLIDGI